MTERVLRAAAAALMLLAGLAGLAVPHAVPARADDSSAVTVRGTGEFADLAVTVSQTRNLVNQSVEVSWSGGVRTQPGAGLFATDFLQIMQCWGDDPSGPTREQCQFGGFDGDARGGQFVASRRVDLATLTDPAETYEQGGSGDGYVPFRAVNGKTVSGRDNEFFDANTTGELPFATSRANGRGLEYVEVQTAREAPGLGCGEPVSRAGRTVGRSCWLVIVPRGRHEVDGSLRGDGAEPLYSSALSATNWAKHISIPLAFEPVSIVCPIGSAERLTVGDELVSEAMTRWQPALCTRGGAVFGYSSVADRIARRQLATDSPGLVFLGNAPSANEKKPTAPVVYAPVAASGLTIAFNVNSKGHPEKASPETIADDGVRLRQMKLTQRLVAKLVTQSYRLAVDRDASTVKANPLDLTRDPDFLAVNPDWQTLFIPNLSEIIVPVGSADSFGLLWRWITSDSSARDYLAGKADPWGMRINPSYRGVDYPRDDFPKADPFCLTYPAPRTSLCVLDAHPYASDLHEGTRAASRGETLSRTAWDPFASPPTYRKTAPQANGERFVMALSDSATAARFGLPTAQLQNATGAFVSASADGLAAGVAAMGNPDSNGLQHLDPARKVADAYPLTALTYAATVPRRLEPAARKDYAALIDYVVGRGQTPGLLPGDLPGGYLPLPAAQRAIARQAARAIVAAKAPKPAAPAPTAGEGGSSGAGTGIGTGSGAGAAGGSASPTLSSTGGAGSLAPSKPGGQPANEPVALETPVTPVGAARLAVAAALVLGGLALAAGPLLLRIATRGAG